MARPDRWFDWHRAVRRDASSSIVADPQRRMGALSVVTASCFALILVRCITLEYYEGDAFRAVAEKVWNETSHKAAPRGRILARNGTPLAEDATQLAVAIHYPYLQQPADTQWLRRQARRRRQQQGAGTTEPLSATIDRLRVEQVDMHRRLAEVCGVELAEWRARCDRVEQRVERMADHVNRRRSESLAEQRRAQSAKENVAEARLEDDGWSGLVLSSLRQLFAPPHELSAPRITIREEVSSHILAINLTRAAAAEIEQHPERYPGVVIERNRVRRYPRGSTAAHVIGYLGAPEAEQSPDEHSSRIRRVGKTGVERAWEEQLRGVTGIDIEQRDAGGQLLSTHAERTVVAGEDVRLTLDLSLQTFAEQWLDEVQSLRKPPLVRSSTKQEMPNHGGGSVLVMDVDTGELLVCASAPRFDPNLFVTGRDVSVEDSAALSQLLSDPNRALFHRATQMALPPGSVFKPLVAIALLESETADADAPLICRGYLRQPNAQRCFLYRRYGVGHGPLTLTDALAMSCNVYFYRHAKSLGPQALVGWASQFGLGQPTGLDLPGESRGNLSSPRSLRERHQRVWQLADTEAFSIGQGTLTTTPLQIVRMMAAIGNGGRLVSPRLIANGPEAAPSVRQLSVSEETLETVHRGLRRVVADADGTASRAFAEFPIPVAGKSGTAEAGGGQKDHAWFAGYAPAENPRVAFVVVLEHAGGGGEMAAPVARRLLEQMNRLGYFASSRVAER